MNGYRINCIKMKRIFALLLCSFVSLVQSQKLSSSEECSPDSSHLSKELNILREIVRESALREQEIDSIKQELNSLQSAFRTQTVEITELSNRLKLVENSSSQIQGPSNATESSLDHMGTEFVFAYPRNFGSLLYVHLYIVSTDKSFSGHIRSPFSAVNQYFSTTSGIVTISLPASIEIPEGLSNKGIYLRATKPVSVFGIDHYECCSGEGFNVYPKQFLGNHYIAATADPYLHSYLAVIGTSNDTQVTFTLNTSGTVTHNGNTYSNTDSFEILLNDLQTVQVLCNEDLSGTTVTSNKPIAVMSGNRCTNDLSSNCNHLAEYWLPTSRCGSRYIVPPMAATKRIVKIFAKIEGTNVTITGRMFSNRTTVSKLTGLHLSLSVQDVFLISADHPVCVHIISAVGLSNGNPMMTLLPAIDQYTNDVVVPRPTIQTFSNYVSLVTKASSLANMRINNETISNVQLMNVTVDNVDYVSFWVALGNGTSTYHIYSVSPYEQFGAIVYGNKNIEAYGYPAAINL